MRSCCGFGSLQIFVIFFLSISLHLLSGLASDPANPKDTNKPASHSKSSVGVKVVIACLGVVSIIGFTMFLFRIWQKKKREEQHARLLKLFEDDDELEVELGIRD